MRPALLFNMPGARGSRDPTVAATLARRYIEHSRRAADPRFLGYAQGVLEPWWTDPDAPVELILLRATIKQSRHQFPSALDDLDTVLQRKPDSAQAWLTRATVLRVMGRFVAASTACDRLVGIADPQVAGICKWSVAGSRGALPRAYDELLALSQAQSAPAIAAWMAAELADMAERLGRPEDAERHYRNGMAQAPEDLGLRAAYADLLLDLGRAREVLDLVHGLDDADALQLRHALALKQLDDPRFAALDAQIEAAFANAHLRKEELHLREEARYALHAHADAERALHLATMNWAIQREPWDARVLLEAAQAAAQPQAAQPVRDFLDASGMQDARLLPYLGSQAP
ncbi:MAG TPA: hypothetical protein VGE51_10245 [Fontimonas sp.]